MKTKHLLWVISWILFLAQVIALEHENSTSSDNFKPRMDYDQWKPLGRGDPLKHDPTYDYVPPVLDRVHYWIDPVSQKTDAPEENKKSEVLLLGISSKKSVAPPPATLESRKDTYDSFLQYMDNSKFNYNQRIMSPHHRVQTPHLHFPLFLKSKSQYSRGSEQRIPYTMLMPPPLVTKAPMPIMTTSKQPQSVAPPKITTPKPIMTSTRIPSEVTVQEAKLVYQSSGLGGLNSSQNHKNKLYKNDEIALQKHLQLPESYMHIQFAPNRVDLSNKSLLASNSDHINYVTAPPLSQTPEIMHKGQVSDDNLDITNTYVKIGKTEAQVQSTASDNLGESSPELLIERPPGDNMIIFSHIKHPINTQTPLTLQTIQSMQTMLPPQITKSPAFISSPKVENPIVAALKKEKSTTTESTTTELTLPTTTMNPTTTDASLTTDPLFKHYKQPSEPVKGPLYLIIQGHSKVKTYGPSKQIHGIRIQNTNEITDTENKNEMVDLRMLLEEAQQRSGGNGNSREGRSGKLQTLKHVIQTRLGAIDLKEFQDAINKRNDELKETELHYGYTVDESKDVTSEKYYKGYVADGRMLEAKQ